MRITRLKGSNKRTGRCRLGIEGEMTIYAAQEMKDGLLGAVDDYSDIEVDLSNTADIDSAGVQVLLLARREAANADKTFTIGTVSEPVREILDLYRISEFFSPGQSSDVPGTPPTEVTQA